MQTTTPTATTIEGRLQHAPDPIVAQLIIQAQENLKQERPDRAVEVARVLVQMRPNNATIWALLGHAYRRQKRQGLALQALNRAIQLDPKDRLIMVELGEALCLAGKPIEGLELIRTAFELGHDKRKPPSAQDLITIRAGAVLEGVQRGVAYVRAKQAQQKPE